MSSQAPDSNNPVELSDEDSVLRRVQEVAEEVDENIDRAIDADNFQDSLSEIEEVMDAPASPQQQHDADQSDMLRLFMRMLNGRPNDNGPSFSDQIKIREAKRRPVRRDVAEKFDGALEHFQLFANEVLQHLRAHEFDKSIYVIDNQNICLDYAQLCSTELVADHLNYEITLDSRKDDEDFYSALYRSLSQNFLTDLGSDLVSATRADGGPSGGILFMNIARRVTITESTLDQIAADLESRDLSAFDGNIILYVKEKKNKIHALNSSGWTFANGTMQGSILRHLTADPHLPQAFCVKFSRFKDQFDNLTLRHKNRFDIENILNQAETQYSSLKKHNLWTYTTTAMRPTDNSDQVLTALTAQLKEMEKKVKSLEDTKSTSNNEIKKKPEKKRYELPAPKNDEPRTFTRHDGVEMFYCKIHDWNTSHGDEKCYKQQKKKSDDDKDNSNDNSNQKQTIAGLSNIPIIRKI